MIKDEIFLNQDKEPEVWPEWFKPVLDYYDKRVDELDKEIVKENIHPNGETGALADNHSDTFSAVSEDRKLVSLLKDIVLYANIQSLGELERMVKEKIITDLVEE